MSINTKQSPRPDDKIWTYLVVKSALPGWIPIFSPGSLLLLYMVLTQKWLLVGLWLLILERRVQLLSFWVVLKLRIRIGWLTHLKAWFWRAESNIPSWSTNGVSYLTSTCIPDRAADGDPIIGVILTPVAVRTSTAVLHWAKRTKVLFPKSLTLIVLLLHPSPDANRFCCSVKWDDFTIS